MLQKITMVLLALTFFSTAQAQVIAVVGNKKVTLQEFQKKYDETEVAFNRPSPEVFLEDIVRYEIGLQEARKKNLQNDPIIKDRVEQEMYKLLVERAIGDEVAKIKITETDLRNEYKRSPEVRTSHILIEVRQDATKQQLAAAQKRANEIYQDVRKSKRPFEELVKLYSDDTLSKPAGGDIGYQSRVTSVPTYYETALKMRDGQISAPVRSRYGFHIIKKTGQRTFQQADRRKLRAIAFETKRKEIFDRYFQGLKKRYKTSVNRSLLRKVK